MFRKAGILDSTLDVVSCDLDDEDPFLAADKVWYFRDSLMK